MFASSNRCILLLWPFTVNSPLPACQETGFSAMRRHVPFHSLARLLENNLEHQAGNECVFVGAARMNDILEDRL